jgi:hypothetical protein
MVVDAVQVPKQWQALSDNSPFATYFQTKQAFDFYQSQAYLDAFALAVLDQNQQLMGVAVGYIQAERGPKQFFSRRAIVMGGLLLDPAIPQNLLTELLLSLKKRTRKAIYTEIRNHHDYSAFAAVFASCCFDYHAHYNVKITCDTWNEMLLRMDNNRRRVLKKELPEMVSWCYATCNQQVADFYALLKQHYQTKVRKPLFPLSFFTDMVQSKSGRLLLLYQNNVLLGGMLQVVLPGKVVYDYYACANDAIYKELSPSVSIYGITLQQALAENIPQFDTMGAGKPNVPYGVRDFKLRFGGDLVQEGRFLLVNKPLLYRLGVWAMSLVVSLKTND